MLYSHSFSTLLWNMPLGKIEERRVGLKLCDTHELLVYADDVILLGTTIKKNTETLIDASKEVGLKVNGEKIKYMLLSRHQKAGQSHEIKVANRCFENISHFKYLGTPLTNQNLIQQEIKGKLNSGNACYHSIQNILSSRLLSRNKKTRTHKTVICLWFCMGVKLCL
jgi:hypothetical protein